MVPVPLKNKISKLLAHFVLFWALLLASGCGSSSKPVEKTDCHQTRAAFDVGSSTTKLKVAKVNTCDETVRKVLLEEEKEVGYNEALERTSSGNGPVIPDDVIRNGQTILTELKRRASSFNPDAYSGVATSVFRNASNGAEVVKRLSRKSGIPIRRISQKTEARLGLIGANINAGSKNNVDAVWDIGAGSMQITVRGPDQKVLFFQGDLASIPFKRRVIRLKNQDPNSVDSPNPLGVSLAKKAYRHASKYARKNIPENIRAALKRVQGPVIGIGGVHYYSIRGQVPGDAKRFTRQEVRKTLLKRAPLDDQEIGGEYASTEVSNLALVGGMMDGLNIERVQVASVNLTDGLLLADDFW